MAGNKITVTEGKYTLSIKLKDGYKFKTNDGNYIVQPKSNSGVSTRDLFSIQQLHYGATDLFVDKNCQNQTLIISGETEIDYSNNYKTPDDEFYKWYPEYRGKEFSCQIWGGSSFDDRSYSISKNGKPLLPDDKLKVGDKLQITIHIYDDLLI